MKQSESNIHWEFFFSSLQHEYNIYLLKSAKQTTVPMKMNTLNQYQIIFNGDFKEINPRLLTSILHVLPSQKEKNYSNPLPLFFAGI